MIILQFDDKYHHWAALMVRSLALHEPDKRVLLDAVNLSREQVQQLQQAHPGVIIENDVTNWPTTSPAQMAARKPFVLQQAMAAYPGEPWYGLFDADFLVRRPLPDLWATMDEHQAGLFWTNGMWNGRFYRRLVTPSGIVLVRPDGRALIDNWAKWSACEEQIEGIAPGQWYWDQLTLLAAREETPLRYAVLSMHTFADCGLSASAAIWSANVDTGEQRYYQQFLAEYERQSQPR